MLYFSQLPLCPLPKLRELRPRTLYLPSVKQLLQRDVTQMGSGTPWGPGNSEQMTNLSWKRKADRAGLWWGKGPGKGLRI